MSDYEEKNTDWGKFLIRRFHEMGMRYPGRWASYVEFAKWLDVKQSTFSTWVSGSKVPTDAKIVGKIVDKLGPEAWDAAGMPRQMPTEPRIQFLASNLDKVPEKLRNEVVKRIWEALPEEYQDHWYELIQKYIAEDETQARRKAA